MARKVKIPVAESEDLSSILRIQAVGGEDRLAQVKLC